VRGQSEKESCTGVMVRDYTNTQGGLPMSYMHEGRQYVLIAVGGGGQPAEIVAFALPAGE